MLNIPFYPNTKDDTHCVQACMKMVLKYVFPKKNYSFAYLDRVTHHGKSQWTWNSGVCMFLAQKGFKVINIENFDYKQFATFGERYLRMNWGKEVLEVQRQYSDFQKERYFAKKLLHHSRIRLHRRHTTLRELDHLFHAGYFLMVVINPLVIKKQKGYWSHLVVITNINRRVVTYHDPGLPPLNNAQVSRKLFRKAMESPYKESACVIAARYSSRRRLI